MSAQSATRPDDRDSSDHTKDEALAAGQQVKDTSVDEARNVAGTAASEAKNVAGDVREEANRLFSETKEHASEQARSQMGTAAQSLHQVADGMNSMADQSDVSGIAQQLVRQGGDLTRQAADYLQDRDPGAVLGDVRDFARRKPGTFLAGAVVLGVVVGRLSRAAISADEGPRGDTTRSFGGDESTPTQTPSSGYTGASGAPLFEETSTSQASGVRTQPGTEELPVVAEPTGTTGLRP